MHRYINIILLFSCVLRTFGESQLECVVKKTETQKFTITSERNSTGHWIAKVQFHYEDTAVPRDGSQVQVQVEHVTGICEPDSAIFGVVDASPVIPLAPGYMFYPGFGFYKYHNEKRDWLHAHLVCIYEGADLLSINNKEKALLALSIMGRSMFNRKQDDWDNELWTSNRAPKERRSGNHGLNESEYHNWAEDEPDTYVGAGEISLLRNGQYKIRSTLIELAFICESVLK